METSVHVKKSQDVGEHGRSSHQIRPWVFEGARPPRPRALPPWSVTGNEPHVSFEASSLKQYSGGRDMSYPGKYHPYSGYERNRFQFTISDVDHFLNGKQELRVVQIGDQRATSPIDPAAPSHKKSPNSSGPKETSSNDDKRKAAKWCDMCLDIRFGECPHHGPLPSLRPSLTLPGPKSYAILTFPDEVGLCISTIPLAGYGVFARHFIPMGTWIGPYEGKKIPIEDGLKQISQGDAPFLWEIFENHRLSHYLDASDENSSSWMRFIQCARHRREQNLFVFQYYGSIYYRAFEDISVGAELLVWYDEKYPQHFGIPYDIRDMSSISMESIQAASDALQKSAEQERGARLLHSEVSGAPGHAFHQTGKGIPAAIPTSGHVRILADTARVPSSPFHGRRSHDSGGFQQPLPAQPPTLTQTPNGLETRVALTPSSTISRTMYSAGLPQSLLYEHSPRSSSMNSVFRRETPISSHMLRSMSAEDLRKHRGGVTPVNIRDRVITERELLDRNLPPPPPGLIAAHVNTPPHGVQLQQGFATSLPPSVMSVASVAHERLKVEEMTKRNEHSILLEKERDRLVREKERISGHHLGSHERSIRGGVQQPKGAWEIFNCKGCDQNFTQKSTLEKHRCINEASKPYQCGRCQLSFQELRDLQEHMVMHTSERPFKCGVCSRSFSGTSALSAHMRSHTMNEANLSGGKTLECQKCRKRFPNISDMNKHLANPSECLR